MTQQPDGGYQYPGLAQGDQYANPNAAGGGPLGSFAPVGQHVTRDAQGTARCPNCGGNDFEHGASALRVFLRLSVLGRLFLPSASRSPKPGSQVFCKSCRTKSVWDAGQGG